MFFDERQYPEGKADDRDTGADKGGDMEETTAKDTGSDKVPPHKFSDWASI